MTLTPLSRWPKVALAATMAAMLTACALTPKGPPEDVVRARASERWQGLMFGKYDLSYKMTPPSYRKDTDFDKYRATFGPGIQWTGFEVIRVNCESEKCNVRLQVDAKSPVTQRYAGTISTAVDETWVLEEGQWWLSVKP